MKSAAHLTIGVLLTALALVFAANTAAAKDAGKPARHAASERVLRDLDAEWSKAAAARDLERVLALYADDASMFSPNAPIATGKEAIRAEWSKLIVGFSGGWQTTKAEVCRGGDLGYTMGAYNITLSGPDGKPVNDRGKYMTVWKKQPDGKWKAVADIYNSDLPLPETPKK